MRKILSTLSIIFSLGLLTPTASADQGLNHNPSISGRIDGGYRIVAIQKTADRVLLTVYRGDYIKIEFDDSMGDPIFSIPDLSIEKQLSRNLAEAPYFKMKTTGSFPFSLGQVLGNITVIEYQQPNYRAVTSREAAELINNIQPLILDVRTPGEYKRGNLESSLLIPVQELQSRWKEISTYKNQDILIYCATGNRSTVASKILIDRGFKRIYNMRYGIKDWLRHQFPVTQ
jgi:rhodanese-related sulfurtransferase